MDIAIIGAGIAGLAASIALTRAGHTITIYEKSGFKNEIGAAILITPNGNRVLRRWGFDFDRAKPVDLKVFRFVNAKTLNVDLSDSFEGVEDDFGERICAYHRVDLHRELKELARAAGVRIRLGCNVVGLEATKGTFEPENGERIGAEFVVLANGCHTQFLSQVTGEDTPTIKIGKSIYRWLAPFDKVLENPEAKKLWDSAKGPAFCTFHLKEKNFMMVTYPCRNEELLNCAVFHNTREDEMGSLDWNSNTTHERVLRAMEGCHEAIRNIPMTAENMKVYTVTQRAPSQQIYNGRVLAIGDTIHHMLPTHAQGACSAIEDAGALEILFCSSTFPSPSTPTQLSARLALYSQLRLPRSATTQILSSTNPNMTMAGLEGKKVEIRRFYKGEVVDYPMGCTAWSKPARDFWYGYDIFEQAERAMEWLDNDSGKGKMPEGVLKWFGDMEQGDVMEFAGRV